MIDACMLPNARCSGMMDQQVIPCIWGVVDGSPRGEEDDGGGGIRAKCQQSWVGMERGCSKFGLVQSTPLRAREKHDGPLFALVPLCVWIWKTGDTKDHTLYIFSLHYQQYFLYFCSNYSSKLLKEQCGGRNPLHLRERVLCFGDCQKIFGIGDGISSLLEHLPLPSITSHSFVIYLFIHYWQPSYLFNDECK